MPSLQSASKTLSPLFAILTAIGAMVWAEARADEVAKPRQSPVFMPPEPRTETLTLKQYGEGVGLAALCTVVPTALGYYAINQGMGGSLAGWAMAGGLLVGPSAGQIYHGYYGHTLASSSVRLIGTTIVFLSALSGLAEAFSFNECYDDSSLECDTDSGDTEDGINFGFTVYALGVTYSLIQPLFRVRISNRVSEEERANRPNKFGLLPHTLTPVFIPEIAGRMKTGLIAGWGF